MMKLNSDLSSLAVFHSENAKWTPSPALGVERMMLERVGNEKVTRASTIVKYQPGSKFPTHVHDGGEEFLVLEATFSDMTGDFSQGFYVRNPVGSHHEPWSEGGTVIFVKLGQMDPADKAYVRIDTKGADWQCHTQLGMKVLPLHTFGLEYVRLVSLGPECALNETAFPNGAEVFVITGRLNVSKTLLKAKDWLRAPAGSNLSIRSNSGAIFYLKTGHLAVGTLPESGVENH